MNFLLSKKYMPSYMMMPGLPPIKNLGRRTILILSDRQEAIINLYLSHFNIELGWLRQRTRAKKNVYHRAILSYILYHYTDMVMVDIAKFLMLDNHTTIRHSLIVVEGQLSLKVRNSYQDDTWGFVKLIDHIKTDAA